MFKFFKQKCPKKGKDYPEEFGKKFCSENCKEEYRKQLVKEQ